MYRGSAKEVIRIATLFPGSYLAATLTGAYTVTDQHAQRMALDPGGSTRVVTLPPAIEGLWYEFKNTADAAEDLTIKTPAAATVATLHRSEACRVEVVDGVWTQTFSVYATAPASAAFDVIAESTPAAGVTVDGLRIKDAAVTPAAGAAAWADLSNCATGEADVILGANLANGFSLRTSALDFLIVSSTTATPGAAWTFTHTGAGTGVGVTGKVNHATNAHVAFESQGTQLTTARTGGTVRAVQGKCTSLAGDLNSVVYSDFFAATPVDGGGTVVHSAFSVGSGHDRALDLSLCATGEGIFALADNLAVAAAFKEGTNSYLTFMTTNSSESVAVGVALTTTDGVASGTARKVGGGAFASIVASTAQLGTVETRVVLDQTYTMPANTLKAGTRVKIKAAVFHTLTTGAETHTLAVALGATDIATSGAIDPADNGVTIIEFEFLCRSTGGSGTICGVGTAATALRAASPALQNLMTGSAATSTTTIDTTAAQVIGIAIDRQAAATDTDSCRLDYLTVEIIG